MLSSIRNLRRHSLFSIINLTGLTLAVGIGLTVSVFLNELHSFDEFHEDKERIYRVNSTIYNNNGEPRNYATSSMYIGDRIGNEIPGIESLVKIRLLDVSLSLFDGNKGISLQRGYWTNSSFLEVFSFKILSGDPHSALEAPFHIVLTQSKAMALFGSIDIAGQSITISSGGRKIHGTISAVVEDPPWNSHLQFEFLGSLSTLKKITKDASFLTRRDFMWNSKIYVRLKSDVQEKDVSPSLTALCKRENENSEGRKIVNHLQNISDIVPSTQYNNQMGPQFSQQSANIIILLSLVVIISACFNYTNLSLARSLRRSKEVVTRKILGSSRFQIAQKFLTESAILSIIALFFSIMLFFYCRNYLISLEIEEGLEMYRLDLRWWYVIPFILLAIIIGVAAGIVPAFALTKVDSQSLGKANETASIFGKIKLRQILVFLQFVISIGLTTFSTLLYKQYDFAINYDLGYETSGTLNLYSSDHNLTLLESSFEQIPGIEKMARSSVIMGTGWSNWNHIISADLKDTINNPCNIVEPSYLELLDIKFEAGSNFSDGLKEDENPTEIIINKKLCSRLGFESPSGALGESLYWNGTKLQIVGVVKNFVDASLTDGYNSFAFIQGCQEKQTSAIAIKVNPNTLATTLNEMEKKYKEIYPSQSFEPRFYDHKIAETYSEYKTSNVIITSLAVMAVIISMLGLFGITVFSTESRSKEISIRKALGANTTGLWSLLTKPYVILIILAGLISIPLVRYLFMDNILNDFAVKPNFSLIEWVYGFLIVVVISLLTIGRQIHLTATRNPADLLRDE